MEPAKSWQQTRVFLAKKPNLIRAKTGLCYERIACDRILDVTQLQPMQKSACLLAVKG
jgi:hypothetical protein